MLRLPAAVLLTLVTATSAFAQSAVPRAIPSAPATEVSGVTVTARRRVPEVAEVNVVANWCPKADPERYPAKGPPRVVSTYPADGAVVAPGVLNLSITFDQPMTCSEAVVYEFRGADPCEEEASWTLPDRRTWFTRCRLPARADFKVRFGDPDDDPQGVRFKSLSGLSAPVKEIGFATSDASPVKSNIERATLDRSAPNLGEAAGSVSCPNDYAKPSSVPCRHVRGQESAAAATGDDGARTQQ